jgi:periplasmic copper chaperone A
VSRFRCALALGTLVGATLLATAAPAFAHVTLAPATAAPGEFTTYTVTVPNERDDQATVELDLTLPAGFVLEVAQQVPGWRTVTSKAADGVPTGVQWTGGRIPVGTYGTFGLQGRNPRSGATMRWQAVQRYERTTVRWDGPASSDTPAPIVRLAVTAASGTSAATTSAQAGNPSSAAQDPVARSRADLGLVAGLTALVLMLAIAARRTLRHRQDAAAEPVSPAGPGPAPVKPAPRSPARPSSDPSARSPAKVKRHG